MKVLTYEERFQKINERFMNSNGKMKKLYNRALFILWCMNVRKEKPSPVIDKPANILVITKSVQLGSSLITTEKVIEDF